MASIVLRSSAVWLCFCVLSLAQVEWWVSAAAGPSGVGTQAAPFDAIQTAVLSASSGDAIRVMPGVYEETVDFTGKQLLIASTNGWQVTILRRPFGANAALLCGGGEGPGTRVLGMRIEGRGSIEAQLGNDEATLVRVTDSPLGVPSHLAIEACYITDGDGNVGAAGGILVDSGGDFLLRSTLLVQNRAGDAIAAGRNGAPGALHIRRVGVATIDSVYFADNIGGRRSPGPSNLRGGPGAVRIDAGVVDACDTGFVNNLSDLASSGLGGAGALTVAGGSVRFESCGFISNQSRVLSVAPPTPPPGTGGASAIDVYGGALELQSCRCEGNQWSMVPGDAGGEVVSLRAGTMTMDSCLVVGNGGGGSFFFGAGTISVNVGGISSPLTFRNLTIANNSASGGLSAAIEVFQLGTVSVPYLFIDSCIVRDNGIAAAIGTGAPIPSVTTFLTPGVMVTNSNIEGGWPGAGNIDFDALFEQPATGDYRLSLTSPCIDSGPATSPATIDGVRNPRRIYAAVDMGALEYIDPCVNGTAFLPVMSANGSYSLYRSLPLGSPVTVDLALNGPGVPNYLIYGRLGEPQAATTWNGGLPLCFPPQPAQPSDPRLFLFAGNVPGFGVPLLGGPLPASFSIPFVPIPVEFMLQGIVQGFGQLDTTNAIWIRVG